MNAVQLPTGSSSGVVTAVRASVVDVRFEGKLPAIRTLLRTVASDAVAIEVLTQTDERHARGIALTPTQGLACGMPISDTGAPLVAPVGKAMLSRMFDVFGHPIERQEEPKDEMWRSVHRAPPPLIHRSTASVIFETGIEKGYRIQKPRHTAGTGCAAARCQAGCRMNESSVATAEHGLAADALNRGFTALAQARSAFAPALVSREVGTVTQFTTGIAPVSGLPGAGFDELLMVSVGLAGIAFNIDAYKLGVVLLGDYWQLQSGDEVYRTGRVMDVAIGLALTGRVIDPLDGLGPVDAPNFLPIERPAAAIMDRAPVDVPLQTGLKVIDALIPVGRGQRELIWGNRQAGKTAIALDTILNQRGQDVVCVYCCIG